jgi:hypothetical protein
VPMPKRDETLIKAPVRAHRWRRRIESGQAQSITGLAGQEGVTDDYICRQLPLTCLAPDIAEVILDGRQPKRLRLTEMLGNGPRGWQEQREKLGFRAYSYCVESVPVIRQYWLRPAGCGDAGTDVDGPAAAHRACG